MPDDIWRQFRGSYPLKIIGSSENEGLTELLKETLKELRNISSELGKQSKAIQAMAKTQFQPLSPAAEQPIDNNTTKSRPPISASPPAEQIERLEDSHHTEERDFWGDIKNELYYNNSKQSISKDEPQGTTTSHAGSVAPWSSSADESGITASSAAEEAPDIPAAQPTKRLSNPSKLNNAPQTAAAQSFKRSTHSSTMNSTLDIPNIQSLSKPSAFPAKNNSQPASAAQSAREPRVSASTESSMQLGTYRELQTWNWFNKLPSDNRLNLDFESFYGLFSMRNRFRDCGFSIMIRDWIHQGCHIDYQTRHYINNDLNLKPSQMLAFTPDVGSGKICTCEGTCCDPSHVSPGPIADIYSRRKKAQLQIQRNARFYRQWRRIILIMDMSRIYKSVEDLEIKDVPGFRPLNETLQRYLYDPDPAIAQEMLSFPMLQKAWSSHGLCKRFTKPDYERSGAIFQIAFYEMIQPRENRHGIWKTGEYRKDNVRNWEKVFDDANNSELLLRRSCVTIVGIINYQQMWSPENWTMLLLTPSSTDIGIDIYEDGEQTVDREFIVAFSSIIDRSTRAVVHHWDILANYFEKLLSESDTLLEPELHDLLLVDDSKYSKSKRYFWALNILKEIESDVAAVISQLEGFIDFSENSFLKKFYPLPEGKISTQREKIVKTVLGVLKEDLTRLQRRFNDQRELTKDLRDGLFNASAVMESRASTRLGENVRLLTFVSIFFLPLSFTMSIWSINDSALAHINIMIGVAVVLGIITYFVVFNVDNIVFLSNQFIKKLKAGTIEHMKNNDDDIWKQRGDGLTEPALANEQNATPSSWRIPQYVWLLAWNWIIAVVAHIWSPMRKLSERSAKKKVEQTEQGV
ncbi:hypothetical protein BGAL_0382g00090 [Botrytis galanthina]|uniref:Uncharacterized protein n=1 Tax=Botrytis galanthina TaxID=278940 RepID=A0A4S8QP83_9HELO|nr:hypothetical protein BGAL_0382g00090 [Botrytis galanthina]